MPVLSRIRIDREDKKPQIVYCRIYEVQVVGTPMSYLILIITCLFIVGCGVKVSPVAPEGMVLIPASEFLMGSDDVDAFSNEGPVHTVYVDAFYIDKYEVTNAQYKQFIDANPQWQKDRIDRALHDGTYLALWNGNDYPTGRANYPVVYVSWYAAWLMRSGYSSGCRPRQNGKRQRGGGLTGKTYAWGEDLDSTQANYKYNAKDITPVGSYPPNGYGLYDVAGNVWEWCLDAYSNDFYARSPHKNPLCGAISIDWVMDNFTNIKTKRVVRGGSWLSYPAALPVSFYWNGKNEFGEQVTSGVYFYHLSAGEFSATRKMVIVK